MDQLAACCEHLNVWLPEPVVVTWARASCRAALELRAGKAAGRLDALLWQGADVNAVGRGHETALHVVARRLEGLDSVDGASSGSWRAAQERSNFYCGRTALLGASRVRTARRAG